MTGRGGSTNMGLRGLRCGRLWYGRGCRVLPPVLSRSSARCSALASASAALCSALSIARCSSRADLSAALSAARCSSKAALSAARCASMTALSAACFWSRATRSASCCSYRATAFCMAIHRGHSGWNLRPTTGFPQNSQRGSRVLPPVSTMVRLSSGMPTFTSLAMTGRRNG